MVGEIKKKRVTKTKNLSSKKITRLPLRAKIFPAQLLKTGVRPLSNVFQIAQRGRRKVKNRVVTKRGGLLYNTYWQDAEKVHREWNSQEPYFLQGAAKSRPKKPGKGGIKRGSLSWEKAPSKIMVNRAKAAKAGASFKKNTPLLTILQNKLMHNGRKGPAETVFLKIMRELNRYSVDGTGYTLFYMALERLKPILITTVRRVGRNYYHVPIPLKKAQQYRIAFQWLLEAAKRNPRAPLYVSLTQEILTLVSSLQSDALKKKEVMYRTVTNNRAYSHYRWI